MAFSPPLTKCLFFFSRIIILNNPTLSLDTITSSVLPHANDSKILQIFYLLYSMLTLQTYISICGSCISIPQRVIYQNKNQHLTKPFLCFFYLEYCNYWMDCRLVGERKKQQRIWKNRTPSWLWGQTRVIKTLKVFIIKLNW